MWEVIARFVLRFRIGLLLLFLFATVFMGYHASQVQLSYEFSKAIPVDNPKYIAYQAFRQKFGDDGNLMVIGIQTDRFFEKDFFNDYTAFTAELKKIPGVDDLLSIPSAINLVKNGDSEKFSTRPVFPAGPLSQIVLDSSQHIFQDLIFYRGVLYNPATHAYLTAVNINKEVLNSAKRNKTVADITAAGDRFGQAHHIGMHYSGLPLIRTNMATRVASEMKGFLLGSVLLSALILLFFFRSISTMALSLAVVIIGVVFSLGTMHLLGYKITLLNALIPPLIVVIGIPNCIYFLNKFHTSFVHTRNKQSSLLEMIRKMGVVTLFCNIAAAIGFGVFALTKSAILKEFGMVAGINIMLLFVISFVLIPGVLSFLPDPKQRHIRYLENKWLTSILDRLEEWTLNHRTPIFITTFLVLAVSVAGIFRLRSEGFIVDDLPRTDPIYVDLRFFEQNFSGVMPLEIVIDTKRKNGLRINPLQLFEKIDSLSTYIAAKPEFSKPLSMVEFLKFAKQAYYNGDTASYGLPNSFEIGFLAPYINMRADSNSKNNKLSKLVSAFIDSNKQQTRISANMADVGSKRLPVILNDIQKETDRLFDTAKYSVQLTGSSVTFLEGSTFIINGLKESILWAFY